MPENGQKAYSMEVVQRAEDAYCVDGLTFEQTATLTGVAASTLKRWSERYQWQARREEIRTAMSAIRRSQVLVRAKSLSQYLASGKAADAFACAAIESAMRKASGAALKNRDPAPPDPENLREIKTEADAIAALEEAIQMKLNLMLANPGVLSFAEFKEVKATLELLRGMRAGPAGAASGEQGKKGAGFSAEAVDKIRRDILGIKH